MYSLLKNNKKGALELSMNAIVIIVLAFAMLGLGLVFTRTLLSQATSSAGSVTDTAKQQILDSLREGNKKLSVQQEVKMQSSDSTVIGIGLKNTVGSGQDFSIKIYGDKAKIFCDAADGCTDSGDLKYLPALKTFYNDSVAAKRSPIGSFVFNPSKSLGADEADVLPIRFQAGSAKGTQLYTIIVSYGTTEYATADLFITIQ